MREIMKDSSHNGFAQSNNLSEKEIELLFSSMLLQMMETMRECLESMICRTAEHRDYVAFCQEITSEIRSQGSDIRPLIQFFTRPSLHYWPDMSDPNLYRAGLVSYIIRLTEEPSNKTSNALFHFLYSGWKNQATGGIVRKHRHLIREGMKHWVFVNFMLTEYVPATICVGFNTPGVWILNIAYLSVLATQITKRLEGNHPIQVKATFKYTLNLMKVIMNGLLDLNSRATLHCMEDLEYDRGMMSIVCQFWLAVETPMKNYASNQNAEDRSMLDEILGAFENVRSQMLLRMRYTGHGDWGVAPFDITVGKYTQRFASIIKEDVELSWTVSGDRIVITGGSEGSSIVLLSELDEFVAPLGEILDGEAPSSNRRVMNVLF